MQDRSHGARRPAARHGAVTSGRPAERAFTLIEMVVVTTIIAMMAALILPNLVAVARSRALRDAEAAVLRLPSLARNAAVRSGDPVVLRVDGDALVLERVSWAETLPAPAAPAGGAAAPGAPAADPMAAQDAQSPQDPEDPEQVQPVTRLTLDPDLRVDAVQRNGQAGDASTWRWVAYPDGSSDSASITFQVGGDRRTLWIPAANPDGGAAGSGTGNGDAASAAAAGAGPRWVTGDAPDTSNDSWAAGDLEQRGGGTQGSGGGGAAAAAGAQGAQGG